MVTMLMMSDDDDDDDDDANDNDDIKHCVNHNHIQCMEGRMTVSRGTGCCMVTSGDRLLARRGPGINRTRRRVPVASLIETMRYH